MPQINIPIAPLDHWHQVEIPNLQLTARLAKFAEEGVDALIAACKNAEDFIKECAESKSIMPKSNIDKMRGGLTLYQLVAFERLQRKFATLTPEQWKTRCDLLNKIEANINDKDVKPHIESYKLVEATVRVHLKDRNIEEIAIAARFAQEERARAQAQTEATFAQALEQRRQKQDSSNSKADETTSLLGSASANTRSEYQRDFGTGLLMRKSHTSASTNSDDQRDRPASYGTTHDRAAQSVSSASTTSSRGTLYDVSLSSSASTSHASTMVTTTISTPVATAPVVDVTKASSTWCCCFSSCSSKPVQQTTTSQVVAAPSHQAMPGR